MRKLIGIMVMIVMSLSLLTGCGKHSGPDGNEGPSYGATMKVQALSNETDTFYDDILSVNNGEVVILENDQLGTEFSFKKITDKSLTIEVNYAKLHLDQTEFVLDNSKSVTIEVPGENYDNVYTFEIVNFYKLGVE